MNEKDIQAQLKQVLLKTLQEQSKKNLPFVYRDKFCVKKNQFIHLYPNGRKVLIEQNSKNSMEKIIKEF